MDQLIIFYLLFGSFSSIEAFRSYLLNLQGRFYSTISESSGCIDTVMILYAILKRPISHFVKQYFAFVDHWVCEIGILPKYGISQNCWTLRVWGQLENMRKIRGT